MVYTSAERSLNAKKQLRDRYGKWIFMGGSIKWFEGGKWLTGKVNGISGDTVTVEGRSASLHKSKIESIDSKAKLPIETTAKYQPQSGVKSGAMVEASPLDIEKMPIKARIRVGSDYFEKTDEDTWTKVDHSFPYGGKIDDEVVRIAADSYKVHIPKETYDEFFGNPEEIDTENDPVESIDEPDEKRFDILPEPGLSGDGWNKDGLWGKYGAAGVMFRKKGENGEPDKFMLIQRSHLLDNPYLWQLPGGAMDSNENAYQGAAREIHEELGLTQEQLHTLKPAGEVIFDNGKGWSYTNIAADAPEAWDFSEELAKPSSFQETADAAWFTADEIREMRDSKKLIPAFGANIENIFTQFQNTDSTPDVVSTPDIEIPADITIKEPDNPKVWTKPEDSDPTLTAKNGDIVRKGDGVQFWSAQNQDYVDGVVYSVKPGQPSVWAKVSTDYGIKWVNAKNIEKRNFEATPTPTSEPEPEQSYPDDMADWEKELLGIPLDDPEPALAPVEPVSTPAPEGDPLPPGRVLHTAEDFQSAPAGTTAKQDTGYKDYLFTKHEDGTWTHDGVAISSDLRFTSEQMAGLVDYGSFETQDPAASVNKFSEEPIAPNDGQTRINSVPDLGKMPTGTVVSFGDDDAKGATKLDNGMWSINHIAEGSPYKFRTSEQLFESSIVSGKRLIVKPATPAEEPAKSRVTFERSGQSNTEGESTDHDAEHQEFIDKVNSMLPGAQITDTSDGEVLTKHGNGEWISESTGNKWPADDLAYYITPANIMFGPPEKEIDSEPTPLMDKAEALRYVPVGGKVQNSFGTVYTKESVAGDPTEDMWESPSGMYYSSVEMAEMDDWLPVEETPAPEEDYPMGGMKWMTAQPIGTKVSSTWDVDYVKTNNNEWNVVGSEKRANYTDADMSSPGSYTLATPPPSLAETPDTDPEVEVIPDDDSGLEPDVESIPEAQPLPSVPEGTIGVDGEGNQYVNASDGSPIFVGSYVKGTKDGTIGKVALIQSNGKSVKVVTPNGDIKFRQIKQLEAGSEDEFSAELPDGETAIGKKTDINGNEYLPDAAGNAIYVGVRVKSTKNPPLEGEVVALFDNGIFVRIKDDNGKIKTRRADKVLVENGAPATTPEATNAPSVAIGDKVLGAENYESLPVGSKVSGNKNNTNTMVWEKTSPGVWTYTTYSGDTATHTRNDEEMAENSDETSPYFLTLLPDDAESSLPQVGNAIDAVQVNSAPVGTKVTTSLDYDSYYIKEGANNWHYVDGQGVRDPYAFEDKSFYGGFLYSGQEIPAPAVEKPSSTVGTVIDTITGPGKTAFEALPIGTRIGTPGTNASYEKTGPDEYTVISNDNFKHKNISFYPAKWEIYESPVEDKSSTSLVGTEHTGPAALDALPAGTVVTYADQTTYGDAQYEKQSDGKWRLLGESGVWSDPFPVLGMTANIKWKVVDSSATTDPTLPKIGDDITTKEQFDSLPIGSEISIPGLPADTTGIYRKTSDQEWTFFKKGVDKGTVHATSGFLGTVWRVENIPGVTLVTPNATATVDKAGKPIKVGDTVWHPVMNMGGVVIAIADGGKVVTVKPEKGAKLKFVSKFVLVQKTSAPTASTYTPSPKPEPVVDTSSPFYDKPEPEKPAPLEESAVKWTPEGFLEEVEQRYIDRADPGWSKASVQLSYNWPRVQSVLNNGSLSDLKFLHDAKHISDGMLQKTTDHINSVKETKAHEQSVHAAQMAKYLADVKEWRRANGKTISSSFAHEPDLSTTPFTDATPNWEQAPVGTPTMRAALSKLNSSPELAARGISVAVDGDQIEDVEIRINKVIGVDGKTKMEINFHVTAWHTDEMRTHMQTIGSVAQSYKMSIPQTHIDSDTGLVKYESSTHYGSQVSGAQYTYTDSITGADVKFYSAPGTPGMLTTNLHNYMVIHMPEDSSAEDIQDVLTKIGIKKAQPARDEDVSTLALNRFINVIGSQSDPLKRHDHKAETLLASIRERFDIGMEDVRYTMDGNGRTELYLSDEATQKIINKIGMQNGFFQHGINSMDEDGWVQALTPGLGAGLMPTSLRWTNGIMTTGQSSEEDWRNGAADYTYTWPKQSPMAYIESGQKVYMKPEAVLRRFDIYANESDGYGKHHAGQDVYKLMSSGSNETMFKHGIPLEEIWFVSVSSNYRDSIIERLRARGIEEINGVPIEEFIRVGGSGATNPPMIDVSQWSTAGMPNVTYAAGPSL